MTDRNAIRATLEDRMGDYFRPGHSAWRLNPADLAGVVAEILAAELERISEVYMQSADRARGADDLTLSGHQLGVSVYMERRARELRGEG